MINYIIDETYSDRPMVINVREDKGSIIAKPINFLKDHGGIVERFGELINGNEEKYSQIQKFVDDICVGNSVDFIIEEYGFHNRIGFIADEKYVYFIEIDSNGDYVPVLVERSFKVVSYFTDGKNYTIVLNDHDDLDVVRIISKSTFVNLMLIHSHYIKNFLKKHILELCKLKYFKFSKRTRLTISRLSEINNLIKSYDPFFDTDDNKPEVCEE